MKDRRENWSSVVAATRAMRERIEKGTIDRVSAMSFSSVVGKEISALRGELTFESRYEASKARGAKKIA